MEVIHPGVAIEHHLARAAAGLQLEGVIAVAPVQGDESAASGILDRGCIVSISQVGPQVGMRARGGDGQRVHARIAAGLVDEGVTVVTRGGDIDRVVARAGVKHHGLHGAITNQLDTRALQGGVIKFMGAAVLIDASQIIGVVELVGVVTAAAIIFQEQFIARRIAVRLAQD